MKRIIIKRLHITLWSVAFRETPDKNTFISLLTFAWGRETFIMHFLGLGLGFSIHKKEDENEQ